MSIKELKAWQSLESIGSEWQSRHLSDLFSDPSDRYRQFSYRAEHLLLDLSKQRINQTVLDGLLKLAVERKVPCWIESLFRGDKVNNYERRPALHMALRSPKEETLMIDGNDAIIDIHRNLDLMETMINKIHRGQWRGYSGYAINSIVNIGVGGSDLGPLMACSALEEFKLNPAKTLDIYFVSSMDGSQLSQLLDNLNPETTLFVVSSKSFSTVDTIANANTALQWLIERSGQTAERLQPHHFVGVSCLPEKMSKWGIPKTNQLTIWEWVGGRYSMWSCIGFAIAAHIGMPLFRSMLAGAHTMDCHFRNTDLAGNLPVLLAMVEIWNINFLDIRARAVLPYDGRLSHLPAYLEQLEMESNGKSVSRSGEALDYQTCPVIWGEVGPNAQHAFYQLLHQGTQTLMCDFIAESSRPAIANNDSLRQQHKLTLANFLAQSRILALGDSVLPDSEAAPAHKRYRGNQPCTTILLPELTPASLGALITLYEHKVFVQSVIWDINPFDQWGVELGKTAANEILAQMDQPLADTAFDSSTRGLLAAIQAGK